MAICSTHNSIQSILFIQHGAITLMTQYSVLSVPNWLGTPQLKHSGSVCSLINCVNTDLTHTSHPRVPGHQSPKLIQPIKMLTNNQLMWEPGRVAAISAPQGRALQQCERLVDSEQIIYSKYWPVWKTGGLWTNHLQYVLTFDVSMEVTALWTLTPKIFSCIENSSQNICLQIYLLICCTC